MTDLDLDAFEVRANSPLFGLPYGVSCHVRNDMRTLIREVRRFRRAWEIRDEMERVALAQQAQPLTDEAIVVEAELHFCDNVYRQMLREGFVIGAKWARDRMAQQAETSQHAFEDVQ